MEASSNNLVVPNVVTSNGVYNIYLRPSGKSTDEKICLFVRTVETPAAEGVPALACKTKMGTAELRDLFRQGVGNKEYNVAVLDLASFSKQFNRWCKHVQKDLASSFTYTSDIGSEESKRALFNAVGGGYIDAYRTSFHLGGNIFAQTASKMSLLNFAASHGKSEMAGYLVRMMYTQAQAAKEMGHQALLDRVDFMGLGPDEAGNSCLHEAAKVGSLDTVKTLMDLKAAPLTVVNKEGQLAMDIATAEVKNYFAAKLLEEATQFENILGLSSDEAGNVLSSLSYVGDGVPSDSSSYLANRLNQMNLRGEDVSDSTHPVYSDVSYHPDKTAG